MLTVWTARATHAYIQSRNPANARELNLLRFEQFTTYMPISQLHYIAFHGWILIHAALWAHHSVALPTLATQALHVLNVFAVVYMLPCVLRTFCLHFISSNMHYYDDVESRNPMQQCQVLNVWWLWPMQIFCFFMVFFAFFRFTVHLRRLQEVRVEATSLSHCVDFFTFLAQSALQSRTRPPQKSTKKMN